MTPLSREWFESLEEAKNEVIKKIKMGKRNENPPQETKFVPCSLCKALTSEYEITVTQISTGKILAVLNCCAECAEKAK